MFWPRHPCPAPPPGPPCRPFSTSHPGLGAPGWVAAAAQGGADWFEFQIWPRPGLGAPGPARCSQGPQREHEREGGPRGDRTPTPPTKPSPPRGIGSKAAPNPGPGAPALRPDRRWLEGEVWRAGGPAASDRTPGWSPGGGLLTRAGSRGRRRGEGAHLDRQADGRTGQTDALEDGPPDGQGFGHTAAWPSGSPGRNGFRAGRADREKGRRRRRRRRRRGEEEGREERASREEGGPASRREGEEEGSVPGRVPAGDLGSAARPPHARGPAAREWKGGGSGHGKPAPTRLSAPFPWGTHPSTLKPKYPPQLLPTHHPTDPKSTPLMKLLLIISNSSTDGELIPYPVPC